MSAIQQQPMDISTAKEPLLLLLLAVVLLDAAVIVDSFCSELAVLCSALSSLVS